MSCRAAFLHVSALVHAMAGCQLLVTFDPIRLDAPVVADDGGLDEVVGDMGETEAEARPDYIPVSQSAATG